MKNVSLAQFLYITNFSFRINIALAKLKCWWIRAHAIEFALLDQARPHNVNTIIRDHNLSREQKYSCHSYLMVHWYWRRKAESANFVTAFPHYFHSIYYERKSRNIVTFSALDYFALMIWVYNPFTVVSLRTCERILIKIVAAEF